MKASSPLLFPALALGRGLLVGPDVVKVTKEWNDVFPYKNFNRNVTVAFWETGLLPDPAYSELKEDLETIANAPFIVYDDAFYKVRAALSRSGTHNSRTNSSMQCPNTN
jgi:hypothetical protein